MDGKNPQSVDEDSQEIKERANEAFILLVKEASSGNREALKELCMSIVKGVLFRATRIIGNTMDAEDVTQEVMFNVCVNIHELREPRAFYVWLNRIIMNESNRYLAKRAQHNVILDMDDYQDLFIEDDEDVVPQEYILRESDRKTVLDIVDNLPNQQRKAILLHYYDGLTLTDSAKVMNVSQPRVSRCLKFAQEKIRSELAKQAKRIEGAMYGLAMIPIEPLLRQVFHQEASLFSADRLAFMQEMITNVTAVAGGTAVVAGAAAGAGSASSGVGSGAGIALSNPISLLASVAAAAIISTGVLVSAPFTQIPPEPPSIASAEYSITFSGSSDIREHVNPTRASARAYIPELGEMVATDWQIAAIEGSGAVLYRGEGGIVDEALVQMKERGEDGSYTLSIEMEDSQGRSWTLKREFIISG